MCNYGHTTVEWVISLHAVKCDMKRTSQLVKDLNYCYHYGHDTQTLCESW